MADWICLIESCWKLTPDAHCCSKQIPKLLTQLFSFSRPSFLVYRRDLINISLNQVYHLYIFTISSIYISYQTYITMMFVYFLVKPLNHITYFCQHFIKYHVRYLFQHFNGYLMRWWWNLFQRRYLSCLWLSPSFQITARMHVYREY